jgi:hypothetical protein
MTTYSETQEVAALLPVAGTDAEGLISLNLALAASADSQAVVALIVAPSSFHYIIFPARVERERTHRTAKLFRKCTVYVPLLVAQCIRHCLYHARGALHSVPR